MATNLMPQLEQRPGFLSVNPPHWAARVLAWLLPVLFLAALAAAIWVKAPEVVNAEFALAPVRGTDPVRALRGGVVAELHAREGQAVNQHDLLFVIRSEAVVDRTAELQTLDTQVKGSTASLANGREKLTRELAVSEEEGRRLKLRADSLGRVLVQKQKELAIAKQLAESYEKLQREGLSSLTAQTDRQLEVARVETQIEQMQTEQREIDNALEKIRLDAEVKEAEFREFERSLKEGNARVQIRQTALNQSLVQGQAGRFVAHAPCRGTVLRLQVKSAGAQVAEGETLCELVCEGERLQAELQLPQAHVGRIREGQPVKLLYDAFPYQRFGVRYATLRWLSPSSANGTFRAFADVREEVVNFEGQPSPLRAGMGGQAQIIIGYRSLISFLWEPLQQLKENLAAPPPPVQSQAAGTSAVNAQGGLHGN